MRAQSQQPRRTVHDDLLIRFRPCGLNLLNLLDPANFADEHTEINRPTSRDLLTHVKPLQGANRLFNILNY